MEFRGEDLYCELALDRPYDLAGSYPKDPHIQFLNCETDTDIQRFVRAWGPLYLIHGGDVDELQKGTARRPMAQYRAELRRFKAVKSLLEAAKRGRDERRAVMEFVQADEEEHRFSPLYKPGEPPNLQFSLKLWLSQGKDLVEWLESCSTSELRLAVKHCVELEIRAPWPGCVRVVPFKGKLKVIPSYGLYTLSDALRWMVWFDEWNAWPPMVCPACHKVFRQLSQHKRKYCSYACAHRIAVQNWRKKKRSRK